jgi:hypothetical protein
MNLCSKPSCTRPGAVVLAYDYAERKAVLDDPASGQLSPHVYIMCTKCAEKLEPPKGWELEDRRSEPPLFVERDRPQLVTIPSSETEPEPAASSRRQLFFGYSA